MLWMVITLLILVVSLVFFILGMRLLSEDRRLDRPFMPIKTRVFYALGNVGIALAIFTICFWILDLESHYEYSYWMATSVMMYEGNLNAADFKSLADHWIESSVDEERGIARHETELLFYFFIFVGVLFVAAAIFCLVNGKIKIRFKDDTNDAANGDGMQLSSSVPAPNPTTSDPTPNSDLNTAHCPKCGNTMTAGHGFCSVCGTPIESVAQTVSKVCGFCGEKVEHGEVYCPNCGHRL